VGLALGADSLIPWTDWWPIDEDIVGIVPLDIDLLLGNDN
jgi:hypothetical protein